MVLLPVVGRVEVDDGGFAADGREELVHAGAVGSFTAAGRPDDELRERHLCVWGGGGGGFFMGEGREEECDEYEMKSGRNYSSWKYEKSSKSAVRAEVRNISNTLL